MPSASAIAFRSVREIVVPVLILLAALIAGLVTRKILFGRFVRWAQHSRSQLDDIVIVATKGPFVIWFLMLGIYLAVRFSKLSEDVVDVVGKIVFVLGLFSVTLVLANTSSSVIRVYSSRSKVPLPSASLTQNIARIVILCLGILIILNGLGIPITPILATLGVGGLAVALALQDTLSNLFAGFYILVARQIKVGDYIKLDSGEEGYVTDITWRTTKIRMLPNNIVLVPNEKLTKAIVTDYYLPDKELAVLVNVGVHYNSDLRKVEKVTCEVAQEVMAEVSGGVPEFQPFIRYHTLGDFSINFTVILRAKEFVDQYLIKHQFVKRLHERYAKEGIVIPYPIRAINTDQEKR